MAYAAIAIFLLALIIGVYLLVFNIRNMKASKGRILSYSLPAVTMLILLSAQTGNVQAGLLQAIAFFILAASGAAFLIVKDFSNRSLPEIWTLVRGLLALTGFIFILVYILNR